MEAVYRFCVCVNPSDVIELDPLLGDWILHDPLRASALFQDVSDSLEPYILTIGMIMNFNFTL